MTHRMVELGAGDGGWGGANSGGGGAAVFRKADKSKDSEDGRGGIGRKGVLAGANEDGLVEEEEELQRCLDVVILEVGDGGGGGVREGSKNPYWRGVWRTQCMS